MDHVYGSHELAGPICRMYHDMQHIVSQARYARPSGRMHSFCFCKNNKRTIIIMYMDHRGSQGRYVACTMIWAPTFGNRTQNSRVTGARPNHQADRGSDPNHRGIWSPPRAGLGPVRNPVDSPREEPGGVTDLAGVTVHRTTYAAGKAGRVTGSSYPASFLGCIFNT